jgi:hypothetical protein
MHRHFCEVYGHDWQCGEDCNCLVCGLPMNGFDHRDCPVELRPCPEHGLTTFEEDCRLLGVDANYTINELGAARRQKVTQWHPDKLEGMAVELKEYANEQLARINQAYERLEAPAQPGLAGPVTLQSEAESTARMADDLSRDSEQCLAVLEAGGHSAIPHVEKLLEEWDNVIRKQLRLLARIRRESPETDVAILEQAIAKTTSSNRQLKEVVGNNTWTVVLKRTSIR